MIENDDRSINVNDTVHHDLLLIMHEYNETVVNSYPTDTFQHIFWQNQFHAAQQKNNRNCRWHPAMIKWCIFLRHKSSKAYELLRKTNVIQLPSQRTLRDYTHHFKSHRS